MIDLPKVYSGKVRDLYEVDDDHLLMVATDRLSAFDVVFTDLIPGKGKILTQMSNCWFAFFGNRMPNHLSDLMLDDVLPEKEVQAIAQRAVVVKKLQPVKIEAVVRGYLAGGGWKEYQAKGSISEITLPAGLQRASALPQALFTPSTKAGVGTHDEQISFAKAAHLIGTDLAEQIRDLSIGLYMQAASYAKECGIIIADSKFEFGLDKNGVLVLMDEVLTPDSSRFWPLKEYTPGQEQISFDKQFVRNWLEKQHWDKKPPAPRLPAEVISRTQALYQEIFFRLFNKTL